MTIIRNQRILAIPLIGVAAVLLAACGSSSGTTKSVSPGASSSTSGTPVTSTSTSATQTPAVSTVHNDADVMFATGMIPHHLQAVAMAKLADTRATSKAVKDLATKIKAAQQPEITLMTGWLKAWGKPVPAAMGGMDMGGGMMSQADMTKLMDSKGATFDKMFLTMMIAHHKGAIAMAATEASSGKNAGALTLAKNIATSQTGEITTMQGLLGK